jgi:ribose transport system substrate-binding protein
MNRFEIFLAGAVTVGLLLGGVAGCSKSKSAATATQTSSAAPSKHHHFYIVPKGKTPKIAFISNNTATYWNLAHVGIRKFEKQTGVHVRFLEPQNATVAEQDNYLNDLIADGYDAVALSVISPKGEVNELNRVARHMNLVCVDSDSPQSNRLIYIGTDNIAAGKLMGKEMVKLLPKGGDVAVFVGTFSAANARQRLDGILDVVKGHHIKIAVKRTDGGDAGRARDNAENVLAAYPKVKLLCGLWSYDGPALAAAVEGAGKQGTIKIVAFDQSQGTLLGIQKGVINATVVQNPIEEGYLSAKWMLRFCRKGKAAMPSSDIIPTGVKLITKTNLAAYWAKLKKLSGQK